jgi:hypothetical protein
MQMTGEQRIPASKQHVWEALNDPAVLRQCIPGCQTLDKESDDRLVATVEIKIGPIGARFKGNVQLGDLDPPNGYTLTGEGNGGIAGNAKGAAKVALSDDVGGTLLAYTVDAQVGGRLAQLGGPIIDATAKQLAGRFFAKLGEVVGGEQATAPAPAAAPAKAAPTAQAAPVTSHAATAPGPAAGAGLPTAWILAAVVAALAGFLIGRSGATIGSDWSGLAIGLLVVVVAAAGFEHGRRSGATTLVLDDAALRRLIEVPRS